MTAEDNDTILLVRIVHQIAKYCGERPEAEPTTKRRMLQTSIAVSLLDNSCNGHRASILATVADVLDNARSELVPIDEL